MTIYFHSQILLTKIITLSVHLLKPWGFPGDSVVKTPPASTADTDSIPGLGSLSCHGATEPHVPQPLGLCPRAQKPQLLKPVHLEPVCCNQKPPRREQPPLAATREKPKPTGASSTAKIISN